MYDDLQEGDLIRDLINNIKIQKEPKMKPLPEILDDLELIAKSLEVQQTLLLDCQNILTVKRATYMAEVHNHFCLRLTKKLIEDMKK